MNFFIIWVSNKNGRHEFIYLGIRKEEMCETTVLREERMDGWMDGWDVQDAMSELKAAVLREGRIDGWDIQDAMGELTTHE